MFDINQIQTQNIVYGENTQEFFFSTFIPHKPYYQLPEKNLANAKSCVFSSD